MSIRITPGGTRGARFGQMPRPLVPIFNTINVAFFRITTLLRLAGIVGKIQGRPLLLLKTVGGKSGRTRHTTLGWFADDDPRRRSWLIVASNGGAAKHPAWYFNLARRPDDIAIELGGERIPVRAQSLQGEERARAWQRVAHARGYAHYATATDRVIPVIRLVPR